MVGVCYVGFYIFFLLKQILKVCCSIVFTCIYIFELCSKPFHCSFACMFTAAVLLGDELSTWQPLTGVPLRLPCFFLLHRFPVSFE